jgi:hypothetical protein
MMFMFNYETLVDPLFGGNALKVSRTPFSF